LSCPTDEKSFSYNQTAFPVANTDPAGEQPIGITAAGHDVDIKVIVGPFSCPVDVVFGAYAAGIDPDDVYFLDSDYSLKTRSMAVVEEAVSRGADRSTDSEDGEHSSGRPGRFRNIVFWKNGVTQVNEDLKAQLPSGLYVLSLVVKPSGSGNDESYYRWTTHFIVP
jgi:hypothetical protein